ncbi:MAG: S8 family serine peptidase [Candidatus Kapabacteria bacterium]|nr:S8 family serine peptidase [Candidatus Kapabacteria bacterium]
MRRQTYETASVCLALLLSAALMTDVVSAQRIPYRVSFFDKGPIAFTPGTAVYDSVVKTFHPRSRERRARMGMNPVLDTLDAPIYAPYLAAVRSISDSILVVSPWFNNVIVGLTESELVQVRKLPSVRSVVIVSSIGYFLEGPTDCDPPHYGRVAIQQEILNTALVHNAGVYGTGVRVGLYDTGFRWRAMSSLQHLNVSKEYDVIYGDSSTANDDRDPGNQDEHGSIVLSILAGWEQDSLIGVAPFGTYLLAKSEDMRYERRIEEEIYVSALTWLEQQGADVSSSSLGYLTFDSTDVSTPYAALDGHTTFASRAINIAASRGVLCVTAAGNDGPAGRTLITPADADSALTIGAISLDGVTNWPRSSFGPTSDGRTKPDFAALGMAASGQAVDGRFIRSSGPSLATPQVAGQIALLRELYPSTLPWIVKKAMRDASAFPVVPDSVLGHSAVNVYQAARLLGPGVGPPSIVTSDSKRTILTSIFCDVSMDVKLILRDPVNGTISEVLGRRIEEPWYVFTIEPTQLLRDSMLARIEAVVPGSSRAGSFPRDSTWFIVPRNEIVKPCGVRLPGSVTSVSIVEQQPSEPLVRDHPLSEGCTLLTVDGVGTAPSDVKIVHIATGTLIPCTYTIHEFGQLNVHVPSGLARGAYIVVLRADDASTSLPVIVR